VTTREGMPEDALSAYLDGELSEAERTAVTARLDESPEWRDVLDELRGVRQALQSLPTVEPPPGFWTQILGDACEPAIEDQTPGLVLPLGSRRLKRLSRVVAAVGAAAAAAAIAALVLVPGASKVRPPVASLANEHAVRSSFDAEAVSTLAPAAVVTGLGR
jgi:anti-sigma factor RsiW